MRWLGVLSIAFVVAVTASAFGMIYSDANCARDVRELQRQQSFHSLPDSFASRWEPATLMQPSVEQLPFITGSSKGARLHPANAFSSAP